MEIECVEMRCVLAGESELNMNLPEWLDIEPLSNAHCDELFQCYKEAFQAGDAQFFFEQSEVERRAYFDTLGLEQAMEEGASLLLRKGERVVGFTSVLPHGHNNWHISCMCVHPDFQKRGFGTLMLHLVKDRLAEDGIRTISLGTDTNMAVYKMYSKHGFEVIKEKQT